MSETDRLSRNGALGKTVEKDNLVVQDVLTEAITVVECDAEKRGWAPGDDWTKLRGGERGKNINH